VNGDDRVKHVFRIFRYWRHDSGGAGVAKEHVDLAPLRDRRVDIGLGGGNLADVGRVRRHVRAG
jgi:hypothetical protein